MSETGHSPDGEDQTGKAGDDRAADTGKIDAPRSTSGASKRTMPVRVDFVTEVLGYDEDTHIVRLSFKPDPRRYHRIDLGDGRMGWLDRHLGISFADELVASMASQAKGLPGYYAPPGIDSATEYARLRAEAVRHEIATGDHVPPAERPGQHRDLTVGSEPQPLTFLSVDICGATALRARDPDRFDHVHRLMLQELGTTVGHFHGALLKTTGDGFIAFIDHPSVNSQADNAADLGLTLLWLVTSSLNSALEETGLPALDIRIGADHGPATVRRIRVVNTGFDAPEVVSDALNRAVKVQESAGKNEFHIGSDLRDALHTGWLERADRAGDLGPQVGLTAYPTYRML